MDAQLTIERISQRATGVELTVADIYRWIAERPEPSFMLPARFRDVSFESFEVAREHPEHGDLLALVARFVEPRERKRGWLRRRSGPEVGRGLFLVGPPGVGKTHLLASAFQRAATPKLYASFDELVATAGPLGFAALTELLAGQDVVCIDEVVLEDPGNVVMLVTLLQHMLASRVRVIATANMPPEDAGVSGWIRSFRRELGVISAAFDIQRIDGRDHRELQAPDSAAPLEVESNCCLRVTWQELAALLDNTHPMHDAGWLERMDRIEIAGPIEPPVDKDRALRFVRFIDRVYDRAVQLAPDITPDADALTNPLVGDPRFVWHVARGRSRLRVLLG